MTIKEFHSKLRSEILDYNKGRSDTSAFLIWFLENFFRIDRQDAIDCVCDQKNDKGIDGIFVDDDEEEIYLFQSKFSPKDNQNQGDNDLRNFVGARQWFINTKSINKLLEGTTNQELKSLVNKSKLLEKTHYKIVLVFVTNKKFNIHAKEYISNLESCLESWDCVDLLKKYTYFANENIKFGNKDIFITNKTKIEYNLSDEVTAKVYSINAKELVNLEGIKDRTLFYKDVRYGVGNTRVNKSIKKNIIDQDQHNNFFLYHNGITIICEKIKEDLDNNKISIKGYAVINGCQSILTLYENRDKLTKNIFILVKIIELNVNSDLVKKITYFTNNQNAISIKDLRSNDLVQKSIQKQFEILFENKILYKRKRGEDESGFDEVIEKDFAAQIITAFYLKKPQNTHLLNKLFGEDYNKIFSRNINAEKIYLGYLIYNIISKNSNLLNNEKIRNYGLALFFFSHVIANLLEEDILGRKILENPKKYVIEEKIQLIKSIKKIWELITPDINFEIEEYTAQKDNFFDYKNVFKNSEFIEYMASKIKTAYIRITRRNTDDIFENIYKTFS